MGNYWSDIADFYKALTPTYLSDIYEKTLADASDTRPEQIQVVNPYTLLTIAMLQGVLSLRKYDEPTSRLLGWEKEAHHYLSTVSIYGPPVNLSSSPKEKSTA
jgi:hypothetical protein